MTVSNPDKVYTEKKTFKIRSHKARFNERGHQASRNKNIVDNFWSANYTRPCAMRKKTIMFVTRVGLICAGHFFKRFGLVSSP